MTASGDESETDVNKLNSRKGLDRLKRKRQTFRGLLTKIINKITETLDAGIIDKDNVEELLQQLNDKADKVYELDSLIEDAIDDLDNLDEEINAREEYRDRVLNANLKINRFLKTKKERPEVDVSLDVNLPENDKRTSELTPNETESKTNRESKNGSSRKAVDEISVRLPKLTIEPFEGKHEDWQMFWGQFRSAIHDNKNLSNVEKHNYLRSFLKGPALISIQGLSIADNSYEAAIQILKDRFGNVEIIVRAHLEKLLQMKPVKSSFHLKELRQLSDECTVHVRSLECAGVELNNYGGLLYPILLKLIPREIVLDYNRHRKRDDTWDCADLLEYLKNEVEYREKSFLFGRDSDEKEKNENGGIRGFPSRAAMSQKDKRSTKPNFKNKQTPSAAALNINEPSKELECLICEKEDSSAAPHATRDCLKSLDEKRNKLRQVGRCYLCLLKFHRSFACRSGIRCSICQGRHNTILHDSNYKTIKNETKTKEQSGTGTDAAVTSVSGSKFGEIYLQTAAAVAIGENKNKEIRLLIDGGAQKSFILEHVSKQLKLKVLGEEEINIFVFGVTEPIKEKRKRVQIELKDIDGDQSIKIEALECPNISNAVISVPGVDIRNYFKENRLQLADKSFIKDNSRISVLIGSDYYWQVVTGKIRRLSGSLVASETIFGWSISGAEAAANVVIKQPQISVMKTVINRDDSETDALIRKFWNLESMGIVDDNKETKELDEAILNNFEETITLKNNRYEVRLPWNEKSGQLKDNYSVALNRIRSLTRRFKRDPDYFARYKEVIEGYLKKGIAEEITENANGKLFYLPHQGVVREDKSTTKLRVVFDASSHANNALSLNDCLYPGPNLTPDLLGLLIRFRQHRTAFTADIEQAFLQILLSTEDRNAVRFFWIDGELEKDKEAVYKVLQMSRVIFGATSSMFLLSATLRHHAEQVKEKFPKICNLLTKNMYADDLVGGSDNEVEAMELYEDMKNVMKQAGFNMRKWRTSSPSLQETWNLAENTEFIEMENCSKVLGYIWESTRDILKVDLQEVTRQVHDEEITKRRICQIAGRIYDPIGFLNPFTITVRILIQECWQTGLDWDIPMPEHIQLRFRRWGNELSHLENIEIPRHYFENCEIKKIKNIQLHCFTDSSIKAYGAVIYVRYEKDGKTSTSFVIAKSRVAPLKKMSLPRLELMGAVIGARLMKYTQSLLDVKAARVYFWSDSTIVLHWIKGDPNKWKPFVQNRIMEIQEKSDPSSWNHCPGEENVADLLTRGEGCMKFKEDEHWWYGPRWLSEGYGNWPAKPPSIEALDVEEERRKTKEVPILHTICTVKTEEILDLKRFSSLTKVLRITAWAKRFAFNARNKSNRKYGPLETEELADAEHYWIRKSQRTAFEDEILAISGKENISKSSKILSFQPFLDVNGLVRVGGRLKFSDLSYEEKHPIILSGQDHFTELVIRRCHLRTGHAGVSETLTDLRERFFVLKGRQRVKSLILRCNLCKKFRTRPATQDMACLPPDRIREAFPFEVTGLDYLGPLYVKEGESTRKAYVLLFTCAVTRAVHLEITPDMSAPSFLRALKKFIYRRGVCKTIYSDNAKTFLKTKKVVDPLKVVLRDEEIRNYFSQKGITWKNIVERAAWWGGFWERLVRSVKSSLKRILMKTSLNYMEMESVIIEVEAILNSRPLTYVNDDSESRPLTPGHFLIGRRLLSIPGLSTQPPSTKEVLVRRYKYQMKIIENIWNRWRKNYLLELRSGFSSPTVKYPVFIKEGSVVQIHEEKIPKFFWKTGIITEVHNGRDGKPRSCTVRLPSGNCLKRPVQLLYPLELEGT